MIDINVELLARLAQANLASKFDIANFVKKPDFDDKLKRLNKNVIWSKTELNELTKTVIKAISAKWLTKVLISKVSILNGVKYFSSGKFQNYLVFISAKKCIKWFSDTTRIDSWKSNRNSEEGIENITTSDSNFAPTLFDHCVLPGINFNGHCLINNNSVPKMAIDIYIYIYIYIS